MTQRTLRRSRLVSAIRAALHPAKATALTVSLTLAAAGSVQAAMENGAPGKAALRPENMATRDEILFVDAHVMAPEKLLVGTKQGVETIILEEGRDGLEQITEVLENRHPVAVHIVAHGENGRLQLGDTWLDAKQLDENVALIRRWFSGTNRNNKPDLLLYACNLAEGFEGVAFIEKLAEIAGADVAASDDLTGHADLDGDWDLEVVTGDIETDLAFSEITINEYKSTLGGSPETFTVNDNGDNPGSAGECDEECTLRDALYAANENSNSASTDTINFDFSAGKAGKGGFDNIISLDYDIDISEPVNIVGLGITELAIESDEEYRIFDIESAGAVTISDMTLRDGYAYYGGCIESTETDLTLNEVYFYNCDAYDAGGGLYFESYGNDLVIRDSIFNGNYVYYGDGGAVAFVEEDSGGTLLIENTVFDENYAYDEGGAVFIEANENTITVRDSDFTENNIYEGEGAAIFFQDEEGSTVLVENSYFYGNDVEYGEEGGAIFFNVDNTEITIRDSEFVENNAYEDGGAIAFEDGEEAAASDMLVENSYFHSNYANYGYGGAINFDTENDSSLTIQDSEFDENFSEGDGGALFVDGESGDVVIRDSFFVENTSYEDGGGASFAYLDTVFIYASTFYDNYAGENAGGIELFEVEYANIVNSTFSYNETAGEGGAIRSSYSDLYIRHTTIAFNDAESGGGLSLYEQEGLIENSIFSENTAEDGPDLYGDTVDVAYSLISDTGEAAYNDLGGTIFGSSADLGPLTFIAGVSTPVHIPDPLSPVVDTGDPGFSSPPDFDQRDEPRVLGANTDMGSVEQSADVSISKDDGVTSAVPGLTTIYTIVASNDGPNDDPSVSVMDTFPASLSCSWTSVPAGGATGNSSSSGNLSDTLSMPVTSSVTYTVTCNIDPAATGTLSNTANVIGSFDPVSGNNSATDDDTVLTPQADIALIKSDGVTSAVPGLTTIYTIVVTNNGPSDDPSVSMTDTFPAALGCSWTSVAAGGATGHTNNAGPANLSDTLSMPAGSSVTYTVTCNIDPAATGTLSNTATGAASVTDPTPGNNSATDNNTVLTPQADLSLTKDAVNAPSDPQINDVFDYELVVTNAGPSDATNVVVTDILPSALGFVGSDCGMVEGPPGVLSWSVGTLGVGDMASCTLTVEIVHFSDLIINAASGDSDATDTDPGNNSNTSQENGAIPTIPTLGPWGLLLLALGLGGAGARRLRRR